MAGRATDADGKTRRKTQGNGKDGHGPSDEASSSIADLSLPPSHAEDGLDEAIESAAERGARPPIGTHPMAGTDRSDTSPGQGAGGRPGGKT